MRKLYLLFIVYCLLFIRLASPAFAQTPRPFQPGEVTTAPGVKEPDVATLKGLETIFFNLVVVALAIAGIALFVMLIVGGFKYLTAGASQEQAQGARQTLTYAFIGFVLIVAAFLILRFIEEFTGVKVTIFQVMNP